MYLVGIDIGTESSRAAVIDEDGMVVAVASRKQTMETPNPGWAVQTPSLWWDNTLANLRELSKALGDKVREIAAIGVCGQMHAPVSIDSKGDLIDYPVQLWCDKRQSLGFKGIGEERAAALFKRTANVPSPAWMGFKIQWIKESLPDVYGRTWKFIGSKDLINYRLTGEIATDPSEASGTYLYNPHREGWDPVLIKELGLDGDKLPSIIDSAEVVGKLKEEISTEVGLPSGIPVVAGGGDMLCTLLGAGITRPGLACDTSGTASIYSTLNPTPIWDPRVHNLRHVIAGWIAFGILDSGGGSFRWFKDQFGQLEAACAAKEGVSPYALLCEQADRVPPTAEDLFFLPYLQGERALGTPNSKGVVFGITSKHTKAHLVRALLEGVTFDLRQTAEIVERLGQSVEEVRTIGGGAQSPVWSQIKADIYGRRVVTLQAFEGGVLGAAILAGHAVDLYDDPAKAAEQVLKIQEAYEPRANTRFVYNRHFSRYKELHDTLQRHFVSWAAP